VFGRGVVPWEFRHAMRSWLFPGALAGLMKTVSVFSSAPIAYLAASAAALSLLSLAPVWVAFRTALAAFGLRGAIVAGATCALWYELVYFAPKALIEVAAGNLLVIGVLLADRIGHGVTTSRRAVLGCAALLALVAAMRMQLAPAAGICFLYAVWRLPWRQRLEAAGIAMAVVLAVGMLDAVTWSYPFQSFVENIRANIIEGKSHHFGVAPWYAYFPAYAHLWGPLGIIVLGLAALGATRARLYAATALIVVLTHLPIAHKEYRFLYPALALVIVLVGLGLAVLVDRVAQLRSTRIANLAATGAVASILAISLSLANRYDDPARDFTAAVPTHVDSLWRVRRGSILGTKVLGEDPSVCGVALVGVHWSITGGYTYLHRDIPLLMLHNSSQLEPLAPYFNAILGRPDLPDPFGPFVRGECWPTACVFRRPGGCAPLPASAESAIAGADN
jgi:phosphatidylinositol glycan class B